MALAISIEVVSLREQRDWMLMLLCNAETTGESQMLRFDESDRQRFLKMYPEETVYRQGTTHEQWIKFGRRVVTDLRQMFKLIRETYPGSGFIYAHWCIGYGPKGDSYEDLLNEYACRMICSLPLYLLRNRFFEIVKFIPQGDHSVSEKPLE